MQSIIGNAVVILILCAMVAMSIRSLLKSRKNGGCGCGCSDCDTRGTCPGAGTANKQQTGETTGANVQK